LANKTCDKYQWVSWAITAYFVVSIIGAMAILTNPQRYAAPASGEKQQQQQQPNTAAKRVRFTDSS
jgi:hypothetical protein